VSKWSTRSPEYKARHAAAAKTRRAANPEVVADCYSRSRYGLTLGEYRAMIKSPCAICGGTNRVVPDHCHKTDKLRGPLCWQCNIGLGMFKDDVDLLKKAVKYLTSHGKKVPK